MNDIDHPERTFCVKFTPQGCANVGQSVRYIKALEVEMLAFDYNFTNWKGEQVAVIRREWVASVVVEGPAEFFAQMELCDALRALREGRGERERLCLTRWADIIEHNLVDDTPLATRELTIDERRLERSPLTQVVVEAGHSVPGAKLVDPPTPLATTQHVPEDGKIAAAARKLAEDQHKLAHGVIEREPEPVSDDAGQQA